MMVLTALVEMAYWWAVFAYLSRAIALIGAERGV